MTVNELIEALHRLERPQWVVEFYDGDLAHPIEEVSMNDDEDLVELW